jgi:hypothetical protein
MENKGDGPIKPTKGHIGIRWGAAVAGANAGTELGITGKSSQETAKEYKKVVSSDPILKKDYVRGAADAQREALQDTGQISPDKT